MSQPIGESVIRIGADSSQFDRDLNKQLDTSAKSAGKTMVQRVGGALKTGFKVVAATAGTAAGVTLGTALTKGFGRLNAIEQAESKLGTLLKSTEKVEQAMKSAKVAVEGTAFGLDEAATATSNLAASNVPLEDMERVLTLVADTATVGSTSLTEMSSIFAKVSSNGKVTTEVLNQFGDRGVGATKAIADHLGITQDAVRQMVTDGKIDFETFNAAMETMVGGAAQDAGKTVSGSMANVGSALGRLGEAMLEPVFERLPEVFGNIQTAVNNLTEAVKPLAERYGPKLGEVLVQFSAWLAGVNWTPFLNGLGSVVSGVTGFLSGLNFSSWEDFKKSLTENIDTSGAMGGVSEAFQSIWESLKTLQPAWDEFREQMPALLPAVATLANAGLQLLVKVLGFLAEHVDVLIEYMPLIVAGFLAWKAASTALQAYTVRLAATQAAMTPVMTLNNLLRLKAIKLEMGHATATGTNTRAQVAQSTAMKGGILGKLSMIKAAAVSVGLWIKETAVMLAHRAATVAVTVAQKAMTLGQKALNAAMRANPIGLIITGVLLLVGAIVALYKNNETFRNIVTAVWNRIKELINGVVSWFTETAVPWLKAGWEAIQSGFTAMRDTIGAVWDLVKNAASSALEFIKNLFLNFTGPGLIIKHWDTIKNGIDAAWTWVKNAASTVFEWLKNLFLNFTGPGLIIKHWDTIKGAFSAAWTWISNVFKGWWNTLTTILSYPVTLAKSGIDTLLGAGTGIRALFNSIWTWVQTTFKAAWNGFQTILQAPIDLAKSAISTLLGAGTGIRSIINGIWTWVQNTFKSAWNGLESILKSPVDKAKTAIDKVIENIRKGFDGLKDGIGNAWDGIKSKLSTPINWVIDNVVNPFFKGVRPVLRAVGLGGTADKLANMARVKSFAVGGWTGPGAKYTPAGIVHADEYVWDKDALAKFPGGYRGMDAFRAAIRSGMNPHIELPGYAGGGRVKPVAYGHSGWNGGRYRRGGWHGGVDYAAPMGAVVRAAADGIVSTVRRLFVSYGHHIRINHAGGWQTLYAHLSRIGVAAGQAVKAGQQIGNVGSTGNSTGPHLHFEAILRGIQKNPDSFLAGAKGIPGAAPEGLVLQGSATATTRIGDLIREVADKYLGKKASGGGVFGDFINAMPKKIVDGLVTKAEELLAFSTGGVMPRNDYAWLGELGPELVVGPQVGALRRGTRVYNADETADLMGPRTTITNNHITLNVDMSDVQDLRSLIEFLQNFELEAHRS